MQMSMTEYDNEMTVYNNDIELYTDEYINALSDSTLIYKTMAFNGLLHYIYMKVFKYKDNTVRYNNKRSVIDYNNTYIINDLINIYVDLCFKYNHIPTILGFSVFTGIDNTTINDWLNSNTRVNNDVVEVMEKGKPLTHFQTAKRLKDICEHALLSNTVENNSIGSIFALKANYGYTDTPTTQVITDNKEPLPAIEDVERRYLKPPKLE